MFFCKHVDEEMLSVAVETKGEDHGESNILDYSEEPGFLFKDSHCGGSSRDEAAAA